MTIKQVYLDMDGVLANFVKQACIFHGKVYEPSEFTEWNIFEEWGMSATKFYKVINCIEFWEGIEPYEWAKDLYEALNRKANIKILTSPTYSGACFEGKLLWLKKHLGLGIKDVIFAGDKGVFGQASAYLTIKSART